MNSLRLASAQHSSSSKKPCIDGTRGAVLNAIRTRLVSTSSRYVFLRGSPGTGKSAIAMTLAREFEKNNQLAASFFFDKRVTQDTSSALDMFISSLARQISRFDLRYHHALGRTLMSNPDIVKDTLELQARRLLLEPLSALTTPPAGSFSEPPAILIFDALDECGSSADLEKLLRVITLLESLPPKYRIFFTSRPHSAVLLRTRSYSTGDVEDLDDPKYQTSAGEDILRFVEKEFNEPQFNINQDPAWPPTSEEVNDFSVLSQGLFELAALRVRRIQSAPIQGTSAEGGLRCH